MKIFYIRLGCLLFAFTYFLTHLSAQEGTILRSLELNSNILNQKMNFSVYLPPEYSSVQDSFPVLYLLHGFGGNENSWIDRCNAPKIIDSLKKLDQVDPLILVIPEARNSYYINNYDKSLLYETYFLDEFIPHIDSVFRIKKGVKTRGVAGLSMGGFGSVLITIKKPELFGSVISLSGALRTENIYRNLSEKSYNKLFSRVFGPDLAGGERITNHWRENNPYELIDSTNLEQLQSKNWYIDCGQQDHLFPASEAFHQFLIEKNIPHEYHMRQGAHNWEYWERGFIRSLIYLNEKLKEYK